MMVYESLPESTDVGVSAGLKRNSVSCRLKIGRKDLSCLTNFIMNRIVYQSTPSGRLDAG